MVYVAIAAAAFTQTSRVYCDLLWLASSPAFVYAMTLALFAKGRQRVMAASFAVAFSFFLGCILFGRLSTAVVYYLTATGAWNGFDSIMTAYPANTGRPPEAYMPKLRVGDFSIYIRAANAVATLAFGLMGSLVGLMAFRASAVEDSPRPT